jgi:hypothetical protein
MLQGAPAWCPHKVSVFPVFSPNFTLLSLSPSSVSQNVTDIWSSQKGQKKIVRQQMSEYPNWKNK